MALDATPETGAITVDQAVGLLGQAAPAVAEPPREAEAEREPDAAIAFPLLKVGGVMIFDDYTWFLGSQTERDPLQMPKPGIDAFLNLFMRKMCLIYGAPIVQIYAEKIST